MRIFQGERIEPFTWLNTGPDVARPAASLFTFISTVAVRGRAREREIKLGEIFIFHTTFLCCVLVVVECPPFVLVD
jgi:hypothetical protein